MDIPISGNGTEVRFLRAGIWSLDIVATTWGGATAVAVKSGDSEDGTGHVAVNDSDGVARSAAANYGDCVVHGGKYYSFVTTDFSGSVGLKAVFRKASEV